MFPPSTCVLVFRDPVSIGTYGEVSFAACIATVFSAFVEATASFLAIASSISACTLIFRISSAPYLEVFQTAKILLVNLCHVIHAIIG